MNTYIKYKREHKTVTEEELQNYFDKYIIEGWEIINYQEEKHNNVCNLILLSTLVLYHLAKNIGYLIGTYLPAPIQ